MARNTVTVSLRLEPEEAARWKEKAGARTLSEWIKERCNLENGAGQGKPGSGGVEADVRGKASEEPPISNSAPESKEKRESSDRVSDVSGDAEVRAPRGRKPAAIADGGGPCDHDFGYLPGKCPYGSCRNRNPKAKERCEHGTEIGFRCWRCGGLAKC
jgi:hypothetical protein